MRPWSLGFTVISLALLGAHFSTNAQQVQQLPMWTLTQDARFGSSSDTAAMLVNPFLAIVGPSGTTVVFDLNTTQVKVYDQNAKFVRIMGRKGQGPGEYNRVSAMGYLGDTLWIVDPDLRRYTLFPPGAGEPKTFELDYAPAPPAGIQGASFSRVMPKLLRSGLAVTQPTLLTGSRGGRPPTTDVQNPIVLMRRDGTMAGNMAMIVERTNERVTARYLNSTGQSGTTFMDQPFRPRAHWAARADGNGVVLAEPPATVARGTTTASFSIRTFDSAGREVRKRSYQYRPVPVTARDRDSLANSLGARGGPVVIDSVRRQIEDAPFHPTINDIRVGRDGSALLKRERTLDGGRRWTLVDAAGNLLANVVVPERAQVRYADTNQLLAAERDSMGENWIVRYRYGRR